MILRYRDWDENKELQKPMTVGQFVKEVVLIDENKELKCYRIFLKEDCNGKNKIVIYYESGIVKSHHSTGVEFDYKEILDWEIFEGYSERIIRTEDIISMEFDFEQNKEFKTLTKEESEKAVEKLFEEINKKDLEKNNRKNVFNDNVSEKELIACVQQLVKDLEEQNDKNSDFEKQIVKCEEREDILKQQIKWLEYRLDINADKKKDLDLVEGIKELILKSLV